MALMHFYAQMGELHVGPFLVDMPDDIDEDDRRDFSEIVRNWIARVGVDEFFGSSVLTDLEKSNRLSKMAEDYMRERYPFPQGRVVSSFNSYSFAQKDYYLPALKVLNFRDDMFWSPARTVAWKNNELRAQHLVVDEGMPGTTQYVVTREKGHDVGFNCDCGIYGSVNIEELNTYYTVTRDRSMVMLDPNFDVSERKLVIVEPSNRAHVFIARKGWKTTKAFISEVVGETISIADASELLSMVWQRRVDVGRILVSKYVQEYP